MLRQRIEKKKGFSLLELLIYIAILSVVMIVISNIFISLSKGNSKSIAKSEVNSAIRFTTELLRQDIKNASSVTTPATAGASSSTLCLTRNGVLINYDTSGGLLRRREGSCSSGAWVSIINSNILISNASSFTRIENTNSVFSTTYTAIRVSMTFSYNSASPDSAYSDSLQTTVNLFK